MSFNLRKKSVFSDTQNIFDKTKFKKEKIDTWQSELFRVLTDEKMLNSFIQSNISDTDFVYFVIYILEKIRILFGKGSYNLFLSMLIKNGMRING